MKEPLLQFLSTNGHKEQAEFNKASVNEEESVQSQNFWRNKQPGSNLILRDLRGSF